MPKPPCRCSRGSPATGLPVLATPSSAFIALAGDVGEEVGPTGCGTSSGPSPSGRRGSGSACPAGAGRSSSWPRRRGPRRSWRRVVVAAVAALRARGRADRPRRCLPGGGRRCGEGAGCGQGVGDVPDPRDRAEAHAGPGGRHGEGAGEAGEQGAADEGVHGDLRETSCPSVSTPPAQHLPVRTARCPDDGSRAGPGARTSVGACRLPASRPARRALPPAPRAAPRRPRPPATPSSGRRSATGCASSSAPTASSPVVAVAVYYDVGIRSEPEGRTGFAHLFEHLMFQGSAEPRQDRALHASAGQRRHPQRLDAPRLHELLRDAAEQRHRAGAVPRGRPDAQRRADAGEPREPGRGRAERDPRQRA